MIKKISAISQSNHSRYIESNYTYGIQTHGLPKSNDNYKKIKEQKKKK